jgi:uncharacterized protein
MEVQKTAKIRHKTNSLSNEMIHGISLEMTNDCNFNCIYCYGKDRKARKTDKMSWDTAKSAVDWLIKQSGDEPAIGIGFIGGEPLLNYPIVQKVTKYVKKKIRQTNKNISLSMTTNGSLLNQEKIAFLKENNIKVTISLDGPPEIQNIQRPLKTGKNSFKSVLSKSVLMLAEMPDTACHATLCGQSDPIRIKEFLQEIGFWKIGLNPVASIPNSRDGNEDNLNFDHEGMLLMIESEAEQLYFNIKNRKADQIKKYKNFICNHLEKLLNEEKRDHSCGAGTTYVSVSLSGDVFLCHRFLGNKAYRLGNIYLENLDRNSYLRKPANFIEKCSNCISSYICPGGCYHNNLTMNGSVFQPYEQTCRLSRRMSELVKNLYDTLNEDDITFLISEGIISCHSAPAAMSKTAQRISQLMSKIIPPL